MSTFFHLLHLADSALPTGGYAFSAGLEAAAKLQLIESQMELRSYLRAQIEDWAGFELPWLNGFLEHSSDAQIATAAADYHATFQVPSMMRASQIQGRGLLRFLQRIHPGPVLEAAIAPLEKPSRPRDWLHIVPVFACGLRALGHSPADLRRLFLFVQLRDHISAAVRLGLLGPTDGHALQAELYPECDTLAGAAATLGSADAWRACPYAELAQASHHRLYSRLFQS